MANEHTTQKGDNVGLVIRTVVVMGPSGCGKSTIGRKLAEHVGAEFIDADHHHPITNVEKMKSGEALTDADREPWLRIVSNLIHERHRDSRVVLACSALKEKYRAILSRGDRRVQFACLDVLPAELAHRLKSRNSHFFHPSLLQSQLDSLEVPRGDEIDGTLQVEQIVALLSKRARWTGK